jgi:hypothetical protein
MLLNYPPPVILPKPSNGPLYPSARGALTSRVFGQPLVLITGSRTNEFAFTIIVRRFSQALPLRIRDFASAVFFVSRRLCVTVNSLLAVVHAYQLCNQLFLHVIGVGARNQFQGR